MSFLLGSLFFLAPLWPAAADQDVVLLASLAPEKPQAGGEFTLTLGINWPKPSEVRYTIPELPAGITLKLARIEGALHRGDAGADQPGPDVRWTEIEFTFSAARPGEFTLGPFPVFAPGHELSSGLVRVSVEGPPGTRRDPPVLVWDSLPTGLVVGEPVILRLLLRNALPESSATCVVDASEGTLLETLPLTDADRAAGAVARFRLTAIAAGRVHLNPARLMSPSLAALRTPAVDFEALSSPAAASSSSRLRPSLRMRPLAATGSALAPAFSFKGLVLPSLPPFLSAPSRLALAKAAALWDEGAAPEALAVLRAAERVSPSGPVLTDIREEAERGLGLPPSSGESWAPPSILIPAGLLLLFCSIVLFLYTFLKAEGRKASALRRASVPFLVSLLALGWCAFVSLDAQGRLFRGRPAVLKPCSAWLVPESSGGSSAEFAGGEAVRLFPGDAKWSYVEADDGRSGWIAAENAVLY